MSFLFFISFPNLEYLGFVIRYDYNKTFGQGRKPAREFEESL